MSAVARAETNPGNPDSKSRKPYSCPAELLRLRKAKQMLRASERKLADIVDFLPDATFAIDLHGRIILWNKALERMTGRKAKDMIGKGNHEYAIPFYGKRRSGIAELLLKPDKRVERLYSEFRRTGKTIAIEVHIPNMLGRDVFLWAIAKPLYDAQGRIVGAIESIRDITDRKKADEKLKESEANFRALFDTTGDPMFVHDFNGKILNVNSAACEKLGYSRKELLAMNLRKIDDPGNAKLMPGRMRRLIREGKLVFEGAHLKKNGESFPVEVSAKAGEYYGTPAVLSIARDITRRKIAEDKLKESEEKFRSLVESSQDLVMLTSIDGIVIYLSPACKKVIGWRPQSLTGTMPVAIFHPEDRARVQSALGQALRGKSGNDMQYRVMAEDGKIKWVSHSWSPVVLQGKVRMIASVVRDITERRAAEAALMASEKYFSAIFDNAPDVIVHLDRTGKVVRVNEAVKEKWGYRPEEIIGKRFFALRNIFPPQSVAVLVKNFKRRLARQDVPLYVVEARAASGQQMLIEIRGSVIQQNGAVAGDVIILRDVTEQRKANEKLKESEETFRSVVETSHELVMLTNIYGIVTYLSPACKKVIGWRPQSIIGTRPSIVHPEDAAKVRLNISQAIKGKSGANMEYRVITENKKIRWVSHSWSPIALPGKLKMVASLVRDITERKNAEQKLIRQKEQIEELSKMKERFTADMTHELKTPLSVIMLNLDMARKLDPAAQKTQLKECFDLMWRNSMRLSRSVDQIMQLTRMESVDITRARFHLTSMMSRVCEEYLPLAKTKGIQFEMGGPDMVIDCNQHLLAMAVSNLVSNAIKFTYRGSVRASWAESGGNVIITVADTGIGIRPENRRKIFDKFFKEDNDAPGSGIGLPISAEIVAKMGGRLEFDSVPGKGSTFRIIMPKEVSK